MTNTIADLIRDASGEPDSTKLASLLDWGVDEMSTYLGRAKPTGQAYQQKLGNLVTLVQKLHVYMPLENIKDWMRSKIRALDNASPYETIFAGKIEQISSLVDSYESGLTF